MTRPRRLPEPRHRCGPWAWRRQAGREGERRWRESTENPESQDVQGGGGGEQETVSGMSLFLGASPQLRVMETSLQPPSHRSATTAAKLNSTWQCTMMVNIYFVRSSHIQGGYSTRGNFFTIAKMHAACPARTQSDGFLKKKKKNIFLDPNW